MKFAYADPPYVGLSHLYKDQPNFAGEVDHAALIARLESEYPDGWALSCHAPALRVLLPLCPDRVRVLAWVKPFASWKKGVYPAYAWEPVLLAGGRKRPSSDLRTPRDWCAVSIALRKGLVGAKPQSFCFWLFDCLGAEEEDTLDDLYPGTGGVGRAWREYHARSLFWRGEPSLDSEQAGGQG